MASGVRSLAASLGLALIGVVVASQIAGACDLTGARSATATATGATTTSGSVRLMAVGDVMLARSVGRRIKQDGAGVVFAGVQAQLVKADLLAINLECSMGRLGHPADKAYTFQAPPVAVQALVDAGVDVAGQANNHALDFGPRSLAQARALVTGRGIGVVGAGPDRAAAHKPLIEVRNGLTMAFLAYVAPFVEISGFNTASWEARKDKPGLAIGRPTIIRRDVIAAKAQADVVIVLIHGGIEGSTVPAAIQRRLDHAAISAGASLVLGAHPHMLQGYERRGSTLIAYSLGNFVFDGMPGALSDTAILDVTLDAGGVKSFSWIPVRMVHGLPQLARGATASRILARLKSY
jgi:poly-gamma-glutamate capsule biosynthesis protein CapA/YwtB (metallophosphatase superfamily)